MKMKLKSITASVAVIWEPDSQGKYKSNLKAVTLEVPSTWMVSNLAVEIPEKNVYFTLNE